MKYTTIAIALFAGSSLADTTPWTNQALNPSMSRDRGFPVIYDLLGKLDVPACAKWQLAAKIDQGASRPLMVANEAIFTPDDEYDTKMAMTFRTAGVDYVTNVHTHIYEPFVGEAYSVTCDGTTVHIGYMPRCQNLARLNWIGTYRGDRLHPEYPVGPYKSVERKTGQVPEPKTLPLLAVGFLWLRRFLR